MSIENGKSIHMLYRKKVISEVTFREGDDPSINLEREPEHDQSNG
ncbi:hypothetical protein C2W63_03268 [Bacillus velezensis]|nr:hypothetical protein C2W63_03268 [Bacillus velezensis]